MKIRELRPGDIDSIIEINKRCHPRDMFPDFSHFYSPPVVVEDDGRIVTAGGVEAIAEAVTITDNTFSSHVRTTALQELLKSMLLTCGRVHQDYLYAFVDGHDKPWIKAINRVGFKKKENDPFFLKVG